jgi:hypothetical protein
MKDGSCAHTSKLAHSRRGRALSHGLPSLLIHRISIPSKSFGLCSGNASKIEQDTKVNEHIMHRNWNIGCPESDARVMVNRDTTENGASGFPIRVMMDYRM